ncbi:MAG: phosphatidate cytidylyltransferase [Chloroflexi bacterium]|nr:phosphatidate cytidylyltransferase [Chloroflexota bacterium]
MTDLARRTLTALIYGAAVLVAVAAPPVVFWILLVIAAILGLMELLRLRTGRSSIALGAMFFLGLAALGALRSFGANGARQGTSEWIPVWLLLVLLPTWSADVVAYLIGSAVGRRRLAPRISPGKTWEGTIAGFVACIMVAVAVGTAFGLSRSPTTIVAIGLGPAGLAGDLFESYVKRRAGVKDSGTILPGHGGILDRLDSLTAAALFALVVEGVYGLSQLGSEGGLYERF